jgi:hypothetical protein
VQEAALIYQRLRICLPDKPNKSLFFYSSRRSIMIYHNNTAEQVSLLIRHEAALRSPRFHNELDHGAYGIKVSNILWTMVAMVASLFLL